MKPLTPEFALLLAAAYNQRGMSLRTLHRLLRESPQEIKLQKDMREEAEEELSSIIEFYAAQAALGFVDDWSDYEDDRTRMLNHIFANLNSNLMDLGDMTLAEAEVSDGQIAPEALDHAKTRYQDAIPILERWLEISAPEDDDGRLWRIGILNQKLKVIRLLEEEQDATAAATVH